MSDQKRRRARGSGSLYKLRNIWWFAYRGPDGKRVKESSGSVRKGDAERLLLKRNGAVEHNLPVVRKAEQLTFDAAAQAALHDYELNWPRSLKAATIKIECHLRPYFTGRRMAGIGAQDITDYIVHRKEQGITAARGTRKGERIGDVSHAEINRELALLKKMFNLAIDQERLARKPKITLLKESAPRSGFFERDQLEAVLMRLPIELQHVVQFAYHSGWRTDSEILPLAWKNIDFAAGEVRLDPGTTKNSEGRTFPITDDLLLVLKAREAERDRARQAGHLTPYVFFRMVATGRGGPKHPLPITTFGKAFKSACRKAGLPGKIPHDFRRTAVRNLVRTGIPESVAMKMTGHKTRSVFDRYDITSGSDLRDAAARLNAARLTAASGQ